MKLISSLAVLLFSIGAFAADEGPRLPVRIEGFCDLVMTTDSRVGVSNRIFKIEQNDSMRMSSSAKFSLDSRSEGAILLGTFMNRESLDYSFALVSRGTLSSVGGDGARTGDAYALLINPVFNPNDLFREMDGDQVKLAEDAISAGRLRGQTRGWVNINVFLDGRIEASTQVGHLDVEYITSENGELEFTMPMELVDLTRVPRGKRLLGRALSLTRLGHGVHTGTVELKIKLKISRAQDAPLAITQATVEPVAIPEGDLLGERIPQ